MDDGTGWTTRFPALMAMAPAERQRLSAEARVVRVPAETVVFTPGTAADNLLLVVEGVVRVQHLSGSGRQIVLYRVEPGESCVMTTACLMTHEAYSAEGVTETPVVAVTVPRRLFDELVAVSPTFRSFVFDAYARRITDLFLLIDEVAFQRIDVRLAQRLLDLARGGGTVAATHQQLAAELGTAREVISRQLQEFRRRGFVTGTRGETRIADAAALALLAKGE